jgi:16S rRNA (cytosine967-C5)-methyltransferase
MENQGRIIATDADIRRLAPIHARLARAGVGNVEVRTPRGRAELLGYLAEGADLVVIDAPCTGVGAWRRNPDAKWRLRPGALAQRKKEQEAALERAAGLVRPGGRIAYVTCSLLDEENGGQVRGFIARHGGYAVLPPEEVVTVLGDRADAFRAAMFASPEGLLMTPHRVGTDGFFVALMARQ